MTRPAAVKVRAQDRHGEWFELEAEDLLGRCIQHENDHLDGITIMQSSEYFYEDTEEGKSCPRSERKQVMRILFMGTPDIAAECLKALYAAGHDICAVYTRRDKPVGRKQVLTAPRSRKWPLPTARRCSSPAPCGTAARTRTSAHWPRN